jgi:anhydro-N-acetylmuramic acid kinase
MPELYIGLMSGTSVDGIDAALVDFETNQPRLVAFEYLAFPDEIKQRIEQISRADALISLRDYGNLDTQLGGLFAETVNKLLAKADIPATSIKAIGSHGQTVHHVPDDTLPFSLQIGDPNIIAEKTGITTIADFRRRDIAAGGQGAPLVPAFHQAVFGDCHEHRVIVNIGGIANITVLPAQPSENIIGFDTGPGNTLMDQWIQHHQNRRFDKNGAWGATGRINRELVLRLKQDPYFQSAPPKSTGKEYFSLPWLAHYSTNAECPAHDIQASLCYLTAITICDAIHAYAPDTQRVLVCGGGIHNAYLLQLMEQNLACPVDSTEPFGIHPDHVEAVAFAWLARQTLTNQPGNLKAVTGAGRSVILGGVYRGH